MKRTIVVERRYWNSSELARPFFAIDVIVSAIVLLWFIQSEGKRLRIQLLWLPTIGTLIVGVSFGLPFFLF